ncbi:MAG TPA: hypothetical protein VN878_05885 [Usitatibacter sp.]|nr:hypothetical protein [Usitatibacter sp.]
MSAWLTDIFTYTRENTRPDWLATDTWPTRSEIEKVIADTGELRDDCDGYAFAACYALADLGAKARVVITRTEVPEELHMVAEDEAGNVIDLRFPGTPTTWPDLKQAGYRPVEMSGFFEFGEVGVWREVQA